MLGFGANRHLLAAIHLEFTISISAPPTMSAMLTTGLRTGTQLCIDPADPQARARPSGPSP